MEFDIRDNYLISKGLPINPFVDIVRLQVYQILTILYSSKLINTHKKFSELSGDYEQSELMRLLLGLAIYSRNQIDNSVDHIQSLGSNNSNVGKLLIEGKEKKLTFREACNKIIHIEHINFDLKDPKSLKKHKGIAPTLYMYGKYQGKEWKVVLDIMKYLNGVISYIH